MPTPSSDPDRRAARAAALLSGGTAILCYFGAVVLHLFPPSLGRLAFFAIGPLSIISVVALYHVLRPECPRLSLQLGVLLHVIAGALMNAMAVVQATQFAVLPPKINAASTDATRATLTEVLWGVNVVQAGLDVSWDIFLSLGTVCLGTAVMATARFGRRFGVLGILLASSALALNLFTFPTAPAAAGLVDVGPAVGLWYAALLARLWYTTRRGTRTGRIA